MTPTVTCIVPHFRTTSPDTGRGAGAANDRDALNATVHAGA